METFSAYLLLALRLLMALALYGFLGWGFMALWRDLRQQAQTATQQRVPAVIVTLADDGGQSLRFNAPEVTIGRHPSCEWLLADDTVSSHHARIAFHHDQWWLEDLGSRNGTFLNGEGLKSPVVLAQDDQVRCGQVGFTIGFDSEAEEEK